MKENLLQNRAEPLQRVREDWAQGISQCLYWELKYMAGSIWCVQSPFVNSHGRLAATANSVCKSKKTKDNSSEFFHPLHIELYQEAACI